ncbi:hypothetical protein [Bartonella acomydis]|uniref:Uncharacterized protein n=1 Tax=Bartonella acomydis TaxID=686234 RepID=A0ABP9MJP4_9HYPH
MSSYRGTGVVIGIVDFFSGKEIWAKMTDDYREKFSLGFCVKGAFDYERNAWVRKHIL